VLTAIVPTTSQAALSWLEHGWNIFFPFGNLLKKNLNNFQGTFGVVDG